MGWFGDSIEEENVDNAKMVDTAGQVNNNVIIQQAAKDTHHSVILGERLLTATYMLVGAEILKILLYTFQTIRRQLKKKYTTKTTRPS